MTETVAETVEFDPEILSCLDRTRIPRHVSIIMDGNRRWAEKQGLPVAVGHAEGVTALHQTVKASIALGVETLTLFGFSTENWMRTISEVDALVELIGQSAVRFRQAMCHEGVRFATIGDTSRFPEPVRQALKETSEATAGCDRLNLVLAVSYGGRDDIVRAGRRFAEEVKEGARQPHELTEELLASYLDTASWPDPDIVVRTSGEQRLSNFLIWQVSYSEIVVDDLLWPDFGPDELLKVVLEYQSRERRHGN